MGSLGKKSLTNNPFNSAYSNSGPGGLGGLGGYDGFMDMVDGGGPGMSGDTFEGGGALSEIGNAITSPRTGGQAGPTFAGLMDDQEEDEDLRRQRFEQGARLLGIGSGYLR